MTLFQSFLSLRKAVLSAQSFFVTVIRISYSYEQKDGTRLIFLSRIVRITPFVRKPHDGYGYTYLEHMSAYISTFICQMELRVRNVTSLSHLLVVFIAVSLSS